MKTASRQNDNVDAHQRTAGRILDHQSTRLVALAAMDAAIDTWWPVKNKRISHGLPASSRSLDMRVDVDMDIPKDGSSAEALNPSVTDHSPAGTSATILASVHPHGQEEPQEVSRKELEAAVRAASHVEQDTLEVLPHRASGRDNASTTGPHEGSVPEHEAVPRAESTCEI